MKPNTCMKPVPDQGARLRAAIQESRRRMASYSQEKREALDEKTNRLLETAEK